MKNFSRRNVAYMLKHHPLNYKLEYSRHEFQQCFETVIRTVTPLDEDDTCRDKISWIIFLNK